MYSRVPTSTGGVHDEVREQRGLRRNLEALRRRMRNHQVAVLIERDQLLIGPDERRFLDAALLPVDLAAPRVDGAQNRLAALAAAREVDRVADAHRVAVMEPQPVRAPQLSRRRLQAVPLQLDDLRAGVVLRRDEQQIVGAPHWRRDRDRVVGLERHLPLQIAVVRD